MKNNIIAITSVSFLSLAYCTSAIASLMPFYKQVSDEWHCGYKNEIGKIVVPIKKYESCGKFSDDLAYVGMMAKPAVEDENGNYKYLQGFIDQTGKLIIPIEHEAVDDLMGTEYKSFSEGLVAVYRNGQYGYMNKNRDLVIPYTYQDADEFREGLAIVRQNDKYGAIDQSGKTIVPIKFNYLSSYSEGLSRYTEKNHWNDGVQHGFIDKKGDIIIKASWDEAHDFSEGLAAVRVGDYSSGKWGIIDTSGNLIVEPTYDAAAIQAWNDSDSFDDGYYKAGQIHMYKYTDVSNPENSSLRRYALNHEGKVINEKLYANWDAVIKEYETLNP